MTTIDPYLIFNGNCAEAMRFYEKTIGGKLETMMTAADLPPQENCPAGNPAAIVHACLDIGGRKLMASDSMGGQPAEPMSGFFVATVYPSVDEARRVFAALSDGGQVRMPMGKTFWVEIFGMVVDRFGTPWMVSGGAATA
ncbi:MAG: VOC family protein [Caldimonas sp.]